MPYILGFYSFLMLKNILLIEIYCKVGESDVSKS